MDHPPPSVRCGLDCCSIYTSFTAAAAVEEELHNLPEKSILVLRLLMSTKSYLLKLRCPTNLHDFLSLRLGCCNPSSKGYFAVVSCVYTSHVRTVNTSFFKCCHAQSRCVCKILKNVQLIQIYLQQCLLRIY